MALKDTTLKRFWTLIANISRKKAEHSEILRIFVDFLETTESII